MEDTQCAQLAEDPTNAVKTAHARSVQRQNAALTPLNELKIGKPSNATRKPTQTNAQSGLADGGVLLGENSLRNCTNSGGPSNTLKRRFKQPTTPLQLAAQANAVATALLNGTIDLEVARAYGTIARTSAQAMGIEVQTGRFLKTPSSLDLSWETEERE